MANKRQPLIKRVIELLSNEGRAMTASEMVAPLFPVEILRPDNAKSKIKTALRSGLITRVGPDTYDLVSHTMKGCCFRWIPSRDQIERGILDCRFDMGYVFCYDFFERREYERDVTVILPNQGPVVTTFSFGGAGFWYLPNFAPVYDAFDFELGDSLIVEVIDADARIFEVRCEKRDAYDIPVIRRRTEELAHVCAKILAKGKGYMYPQKLMTKMNGEYDFRSLPVPCTIKHVMKYDRRFGIDENGYCFAFGTRSGHDGFQGEGVLPPGVEGSEGELELLRGCPFRDRAQFEVAREERLDHESLAQRRQESLRSMLGFRGEVADYYFDGEPNILDPSRPLADASPVKIETEADRYAKIADLFRAQGVQVDVSHLDGKTVVKVGGRHTEHEIQAFFARKRPDLDLEVHQRGQFYYLGRAIGQGRNRTIGAHIARLKHLGAQKRYRVSRCVKGKWVNLMDLNYTGTLEHCLKVIHEDADGVFFCG